MKFRIETRDPESTDARDWTTDGIGDLETNSFNSREQAEQTIATLRTYGEDWAAAAYRVVEFNYSYHCSECGTEVSTELGDGEVMTCSDHPGALIDTMVSQAEVSS